MNAPVDRPLSATQQARLDALIPSLRAWARESPSVARHLAQHVREGLPLGRALARIADEEDADDAVFARMQGDRRDGASHCAGFWPEGPCWALAATTRRVHDDGPEVPVCADCAGRERWTERDWITGRIG